MALHQWSKQETTVSAFVRRALSHCSTQQDVQLELDHVKQILVDNGYKNSMVKKVIQQILGSQHNINTAHEPNTKQDIKIYLKSQMSTKYKTEEKVITDIIHRNVKTTDPNTKVKLIIYYNSKKTANLIMKNNSGHAPSVLQKSHVIYKIMCNHKDCTPCASYIGMTQTKVTRRLTCHLSAGAPKEHYAKIHKKTITREDLVKGTVVLAYQPNPKKLRILEALYIQQEAPSMNHQTEAFQLPSARKTKVTSLNTN